MVRSILIKSCYILLCTTNFRAQFFKRDIVSFWLLEKNSFWIQYDFLIKGREPRAPLKIKVFTSYAYAL